MLVVVGIISSSMAEILHLNVHNSSCMRDGDLIVVSSLWFSRSRNAMASSCLRLDD